MKGYNVDTDTYIEITKDELENIALDSTRATFLVILANAYASSGDLPAAIKALKRALESRGAAPSYRTEWQRQLDEYERALAAHEAKRP